MNRILLLLALPAALALTYDESTDGELSSDANNPTELGVLDDGPNLIEGRVTPFSDHASFEVPAGRAVTDATITVSDFTSLGQDGSAKFLDMGPPITAPYGDIFMDANGTYDVLGVPLEGPHSYALQVASMGPSGATFDYAADLLLERSLFAAGSGTAGGTLTVTALGASSRRITIVGSLRDGSTTVPGCGVAVDIQSPRVLGTILANPDGAGVMTTSVPAGLSGRTAIIQAVDRSRCEVSASFEVSL